MHLLSLDSHKGASDSNKIILINICIFTSGSGVSDILEPYTLYYKAAIKDKSSLQASDYLNASSVAMSSIFLAGIAYLWEAKSNY